MEDMKRTVYSASLLLLIIKRFGSCNCSWYFPDRGFLAVYLFLISCFLLSDISKDFISFTVPTMGVMSSVSATTDNSVKNKIDRQRAINKNCDTDGFDSLAFGAHSEKKE